MGPARSGSFLAAFIAATAIVLPAAGGTVVVSFDWNGAPPAERVALSFRQPAASEPREVVLTSLDAPAPVVLPEGTWNVDAAAAGFWHARQTIAAGADTSAPTALTVILRPAGVLSGKVTAERVPTLLSARFEGLGAGDQPLHGESNCPVTEGTFTCSVPAGVLDVRLHAPGHVTRFFFQRSVTVGSRTDLGTVKLVPGQVIVGRVELPPGKRSAPGLAVLVQAANFGPRSGAVILQQRATVEKSGVFHLDGVAPGAYTVTATAAGGLVSDIIEVPVRPFAETELRHPLVLYPALALALEITPPQAPDRTSWRVRLASGSGAGVGDDLVATSASPDGRWSTSRLRAGSYTVSVEQTNGDVWYRSELLLGESDDVRRIELTAQPVTGTLHLGDVPLQAKLTFARADVRVHTVSETDGTFSLRLPGRDPKGWNVTVESTAPDVHREVDDVELHESAGGPRTVEITLPATTLSGRVVDESGAAAALALLTFRPLAAKAHQFQTSAGPDGTFQVHALEEGAYEIRAVTMAAQSDPVAAKCCSEDDEVTIVVRKQRELSGRVVSAFGPIGGARIVITPRDARPQDPVLPVTTQADGTFSQAVTASTAELDFYVNAHGFAFTIDHMRYQPGRFLITVDHRGGALNLRGKGSAHGAALVQDGAIIDAALLAFQAGGQTSTTSDGWSVMVPFVEPGPYSLCSVPAANRAAFRLSNGAVGGRCTSGHLPPGGTLSLTMPE